MGQYKDSTFLSKARNKKGNGPDYYGQVEVSEDLIRYLASQLKAGEEPILRTAIWRKENDRGVYLSMQLSVPRETEGGGARSGRSAERSERGGARRAESRRRDDDDEDPDEIPF